VDEAKLQFVRSWKKSCLLLSEVRCATNILISKLEVRFYWRELYIGMFGVGMVGGMFKKRRTMGSRDGESEVFRVIFEIE